MTEHRLTVPRTALYHALGEAGPSIREIWLVCHGFGQLAADFIGPFEPIASPDRLIVAPEALNRFYLEEQGGPHGPGHPVGATWMTRHDRAAEIRDYVEYLDLLMERVRGECAGDPAPRVTALGFSQGAATAARWAALGRTPPADRLVLWGSGTPPDLDLEILRGRLRSELILVSGGADRQQSAGAVQNERQRLRDAAIPDRLLTHPGGHRLDRQTLLALAGE